MGLEKVRKVVPDEDEHKIDLQIYWKIFWRKKYYFIVPVILSLAISLIGLRWITPLYESSSLLTIEEQNILERTMQRYISTADERNREINMQYRAIIETRLKSRSFLESVARDLGLDAAPELLQFVQTSERGRSGGMEQGDLLLRHLVSVLRDKITVQNPDLGFFKISVYDTDPYTAYVLASSISEKFIESMRQARLQGIRQAGAFSDEQLAIYREKLEASEKELTEVRREMANREVGSNPVSAQNLHYAEALKNSIDARIERYEIALNRVRSRLISIFNLVPSTGRLSNDETIKNLENQLAAHGGEQLLQELSSGVDAPESDEQFTFLSNELRRRIAEIVSEEYETFAKETHPVITEYYFQQQLLVYQRSKGRKLQSYIDQHKANSRRRPILERELNRLSSEVETNRAIYQAFLESKTSAQITEAIQNTNLGLRINIIEKADRPLEPVKPVPMKIILVALFFGSACGVGSILVTEYMDDSFRNVEEVQRFLKLPVLGTVPKTISGFAWEKHKRGKMILVWIIGIILFISIVSAALYVYERNMRKAGIGVRFTEESR